MVARSGITVVNVIKTKLKMSSMWLVIVSGAIKGTGRTKVYRELGWELLSNRRLRRKLTIFHSIIHSYCPPNLLNISQGTVRQRTIYSLRNINQLNTFYCSTTAFYNAYFPSCVRDWNEILAMEKTLMIGRNF